MAACRKHRGPPDSFEREYPDAYEVACYQNANHGDPVDGHYGGDDPAPHPVLYPLLEAIEQAAERRKTQETGLARLRGDQDDQDDQDEQEE